MARELTAKVQRSAHGKCSTTAQDYGHFPHTLSAVGQLLQKSPGRCQPLFCIPVVYDFRAGGKMTLVPAEFHHGEMGTFFPFGSKCRDRNEGEGGVIAVEGVNRAHARNPGRDEMGGRAKSPRKRKPTDRDHRVLRAGPELRVQGNRQLPAPSRPRQIGNGPPRGIGLWRTGMARSVSGT